MPRMIPTGNVKFALVIAERPAYHPMANPKEMAYFDFLNSLPKTEKQTKDIEVFGDHSWLIPLTSGLPFLGILTSQASSRSIRLRILFLDDAPGWMEYPPNL